VEPRKDKDKKESHQKELRLSSQEVTHREREEGI